MHREECQGIAVYRFDSLPDGVDAFVSTRRGGVSSAPYGSLNLSLRVGDEPARVVENRRLLFEALGTSIGRSVWCRQVHADGVAVVGADDAGRGSTEEATIVQGADALVTDTPELVLCVKVADCAPVVLFDPSRRVVGLAHAGWSGTVARISSRTLAVMRERFGCDPAVVHAAIGPSIGPAGYEVGAEVIAGVRAAFGERAAEVLGPEVEGRTCLDLWTANRIDLEEAGVSGTRIEVGGIASDERLGEFYSHRREGGRTGRFIAAVQLVEADRVDAGGEGPQPPSGV